MTATTTRGVKCGNCDSYHGSAREVQSCYGNSGKLPGAQLPSPIQSDQGHDQHIADHVAKGTITPERGAHLTGNRPGTMPATDKQVTLIKKLSGERDVPVTGRNTDEAGLIASWESVFDGKFVSKSEASMVIDWLFTLQKTLQTRVAKGKMVSGSSVPAGYYATDSLTGTNDYDFWMVSKGTGRWEGRTFIKRVIGGHPETPVRGAEQAKALQAIMETGLDEAAERYGREIGRCYRCNRHLTDETSRRLGIGPDCRNKD